MNALPPDDRAAEAEPVLDGNDGRDGRDGPDTFDSELAAVLGELGRKVRPREFDPDAILRRTARRRSSRVLAVSAAGLAVVAGATAFAAHAGGGTPEASSTPTATASTAAVAGTDPLTVPGYFRTAPGGAAANGFTEFGGTTNAAVSPITGDPDTQVQSVQTDWTLHGVEVQAEVSWFIETTPQTASATLPENTYSDPYQSVVGTVNGHPAYYESQAKQLSFWTGPQGDATATIFTDSTGEPDPSATAADLLSLARSLVTTPADVPMPMRVTGLDSAQATYAGVGWIAVPTRMKSSNTSPWYAQLTLTIDGRSYDISAIPGPAVTPSPTGTFNTTGLVWATETVDGLGIEVTTSSGKQGSPSAPTAAQVLTHVTSLGADPSGWTTSVMVK